MAQSNTTVLAALIGLIAFMAVLTIAIDFFLRRRRERRVSRMDELEGQLGGGFYRCHRGYLVNMAHIVRYDNDSIFLSSGGKVYLTRKKHNEFVKAYMWYLQNGGVSCV